MKIRGTEGRVYIMGDVGVDGKNTLKLKEVDKL
jgi:hypothetical protein